MSRSGIAGEGEAAEAETVPDPRDVDLVELAYEFLRERQIAADVGAYFLATADDLTIDEHSRRYDAIYEPYKVARDRLFSAMMAGAEASRPRPARIAVRPG